MDVNSVFGKCVIKRTFVCTDHAQTYVKDDCCVSHVSKQQFAANRGGIYLFEQYLFPVNPIIWLKVKV